MTQGEVTVRGVDSHHIDLVLDKLRAAGARTSTGVDVFTVAMDARPGAVDFVTLPFPGFATDLAAHGDRAVRRRDGT